MLFTGYCELLEEKEMCKGNKGQLALGPSLDYVLPVLSIGEVHRLKGRVNSIKCEMISSGTRILG